jgi:Histidine kinase-, DNA gyrase B-, and HSP90-like ATPase
VAIRTGFAPNPRLLRLLVGPNLYPTPEVCVRELLQNSWDAIELRRASGDGGGGRILVRFSESERWFEVEDDGIGMNLHDLEQSFLSVGSDKLEVLDIEGQTGEQVAFFGIGVLSVFLVATRAELSTRKLSEERGTRALIEGLGEEEVEIEEGIERESVGTTVRVWVDNETSFAPNSVPEAVRKYARHVRGIVIENVDAESRSEVDETWDVEALLDVAPAPEVEGVREGRLGFARTLTDETPVVSNRITLCNGGFLVEEGAFNLLPVNPMGFAGELDMHANVLSVAMARERFQRNERWSTLGARLLDFFETKALEALDSGFLANVGGFDPPEVRRCLFVWHWALREALVLDDLKKAVRERILSTVSFPLSAINAQTSLRDALDRLPEPRLYYRRGGDPSYVSRQIHDEGLPINLSEEIGYTIRIAALRARGFQAVETGYLTMTWQMPEQPQPVTYRIDEYQIIHDCVSPGGYEVLDVNQAPDSDLDFDDFEKLPELRRVLDVGGEHLRLASVPGSNRRVVTDPSGVRYLNVDHPRVRRLLSALPDAIANPLKRQLLRVYLGLETLSIMEARESLLGLLENGNLAAMAQSETSVLTSRAVRRSIERLLAELEGM